MTPRCTSLGPRFVGDPVDVITGEVRDIGTDFALRGKRSTFHWYRYYHGFRVNEDRGNGRGHRHQLDWSLHADLDGLTLRGPEDPVAFPSLWEDGAEAISDGWRLERVSAVVFRARRSGEPVHEFIRDTPGATEARLSRLLRPDGGETQLQYQQQRDGHRLVTVRDSEGWVLRLEWRQDHLVAIHAHGTFGDLTVARYEYDEAGHLVAVWDAHAHAFRWSYDEFHRVTRRVDRRGHAYLFRYDGRGRCVRAAGEDGVDAVSLVYLPDAYETRVRHECNDAQWVYRYDPSRNLQEIEGPYGGKRIFLYDEDGQLTGEVDPNGGQWTLVRDAAGQVLEKRDPLGYLHPPHEDPTAAEHDPFEDEAAGTTLCYELGDLEKGTVRVLADLAFASGLPDELRAVLFTSDELGTREDVFDPQGVLLREERLRNGKPLSSRTFTREPNGNVVEYTDHDGSTWRYTYESWNLRTRDRDPLGNETLIGYSQRPLMQRVEDPGHTVTEYEWDLCDRLAGVRRHGKVRERYLYDLAGYFIEKKNGDGKTIVTYERGPLGILQRRTSWDGVDQHFERDERGRIVRASNTSRTGRAWTFDCAYDQLDRQTMDRREDGGVTHDFDGLQLRKTTFHIVGEDGAERNYETRFKTRADGTVEITDPTARTHSIQSLAPGVFLRTFASGTRELVQFDAQGDCVAKASAGRSGTWQRRFLRSGEGDLLVREDSRRGRARFEYDPCHRLTAVHHPHGRIDAYAWDPAGNLLSKPGLSEGPESASSGIPGPHYQPAVRTSSNRLVRANEDELEHDDRDHVAVRKGTWGRLDYVRDGLDRLREIRSTRGGEPAPTTVWEADYDALGRRTQKITRSGDAEHKTTFFWDRDRLAAERLPTGALRIYVYADLDGLVPLLAVEYPSLDSPAEEANVYSLHTDHRGAVERVEDEIGAVVWDAVIQPYGEATILTGQGFHQPFRLVGQYHDHETGLSVHRYRNWSPELGRFLESDPIGLGGGLNLYGWPGCPLQVADPLGLGCPEDCGGPSACPNCKSDQERLPPKAPREAEGGAPKHTTESTKKHLHEGGTESDPQSPYFGKWNGKGIHTWDGLTARIKKDGYTIEKVQADPNADVRRVEVRRHGTDPKTGAPLTGGKIKKTIYPKNLSDSEIDVLGESALKKALDNETGTELMPPGSSLKKDGTPADGYFRSSVDGPDGKTYDVEGWCKDTEDGTKEITSHAPRFDKSWPELDKGDW